MDGDGRAERVSLRANDRRPFRCRYLLMTRQGRRVHMRVLILAHPDIAATGAEPVFVGLAGVARGHGLQAVVDGRCCGAYVSGQWLFEETRSELRQIHVRGRIDADPDTFPNGASLTHGMTSVCGPRRGEVLVLSLGRTARNVMVVGSTQRFVQRGDTFVSTSFVERQEPFRFEDFENCRPWIRAHAKRP